MKKKTGTDKPWGGRFTEKTAASAEAFSVSVHFDKRLYRYDIAGSRAHAKMLETVGLLTDVELAQITHEQGRVLLTRDRGLLKRKIVVHGHCVRWSLPPRQLVSVIERYELVDQIHPWTRCLRCNGLLEPVKKEKILGRLEPKTKLYYEQFRRCVDCDQIYWQGSHHRPMR